MSQDSIKCPKCGKSVEVKYFPAKGLEKKPFYYEERTLTNIEKGLQKRMGLPFRHMEQHKCVIKTKRGKENGMKS